METPVTHQKYDFRRCLRRYSPRKGAQRKPFIAVDTETNGLGGDLIIGGYLREGEDTITYFRTAAQWLDAIFAPENYGFVWYAHNGGEYDFKYLIKPLYERIKSDKDAVIRPILQGQRMIGFKIRYLHRNYELRDSYALMPSSLKSLTKTLAPMFEKKHIEWDEGVIFNPDDAYHMEYLEYDIRGLLRTLQVFHYHVMNIFGVDCAWTAPATALRAWRHTLPKEVIFWRSHRAAESFFRQAYYGGLVFIADNNYIEDVTSIDFNSMYPSVMRDYGVPVGLPIYSTERVLNFPGIYRVVAHIPQDFPFTMIPYRTKDGTLWPTGDFETYVTTCEMDFASQYGATFDVQEGYFFQEEAKIFTEFVDLCEAKRIEFKGTGVEQVVKIMQNGLYGKFGSKGVVEVYTLRSDEGKDGTEWTPAIEENSGGIVDYLYHKLEAVNAGYIMPHWAAWITSRARLRLSEAVYAIGPSSVIYGDTDSIYAKTPALDAAIENGSVKVGNTYGVVKKEHHFATFRAGGPKNYLGVLTDGAIVEKAKGLPRGSINPIAHDLALRGETVQVDYMSLSGTLQMLRHNAPITMRRVRSYSLLSNSAGWEADGTGRVHPVHLERKVQ